jgi:hypothetical protein
LHPDGNVEAVLLEPGLGGGGLVRQYLPTKKGWEVERR